jgi:hypothetical protein
VIEEPPLSIATPLDEYYVGEAIDWTVTAAVPPAEISVALLANDRLVREQKATNSPLRGTFETGALKPGPYTLRASISASQQQAPQTVRRQVTVTPDPFGW